MTEDRHEQYRIWLAAWRVERPARTPPTEEQFWRLMDMFDFKFEELFAGPASDVRDTPVANEADAPRSQNDELAKNDYTGI